MAENCDNNCASCSADCDSRNGGIPKESPNSGSNIKKVIGVVSGKGGVGKSLVTSLLAVSAMKQGKKCGILDADITGPSIPKIFGVEGARILGTDTGIVPVSSPCGISVMSVNLLLEDSEAPVIWRGPIIAGTVRQFWTDVSWGDLDYLFVDMPPGTGDVPLTVFQSLPVDGIVIVTSPQDLVSMIVGKAVRMAKTMNIPILGIVENMSYVTCPDCGKKINIFGEGGADAVAEKFNIAKTGQIPVVPELAAMSDGGYIESAPDEILDEVYEILC